jgi:hypothetical protein
VGVATRWRAVLTAALGAALVAGACRPRRPAPPRPNAADAAACASCCDRLAELGCIAAKASPGGASCVDRCVTWFQSVGPRELPCCAAAASCEAAKTCY